MQNPPVPDETAADLMRRKLAIKPFVFTNDQTEHKLNFGEFVEMQASAADTAELVLDATAQFTKQFDNGVLIYVSTGNKLDVFIRGSGMDTQSMPFHPHLVAHRLKTINIQHITQLLALSELLRYSLQQVCSASQSPPIENSKTAKNGKGQRLQGDSRAFEE
jgi:hypothetical protein